MDELKRMLQFDIDEKFVIRKIIKKVIATQKWIIAIGAILIISIGVNFLLSMNTLKEIRDNRRTTISNRKYDDSILRELRQLKASIPLK